MATPLTDVHAHFLTDNYVSAALAAGIEHPDGMPGWPGYSVDEHLRQLDRRGIGRAPAVDLITRRVLHRR
jgi:hypothetical protein